MDLPNKKYFKIGEVARIIGVEPHTIRYWEAEFDQLKPTRAGTRQRLYSREDVETIQAIHHLIRQERYTVAGAKSRLEEETAADILEPPQPAAPPPPVEPPAEAAQPADWDDHPSLFPELMSWTGARREFLTALRDELDEINRLLT